MDKQFYFQIFHPYILHNIILVLTIFIALKSWRPQLTMTVDKLKLAKQKASILKFLLERQVYLSAVCFNDIERVSWNLMQVHCNFFVFKQQSVFL